MSIIPDGVAIEANRLAHACHAAETLRGTTASESSTTLCHFAARVAQLCGVHLPAGIQLRGPAEELWGDRSVKAAVGRWWAAVSEKGTVTKAAFIQAANTVVSNVLGEAQDSPETVRIAEVPATPVAASQRRRLNPNPKPNNARIILFASQNPYTPALLGAVVSVRL